MTATHSYLSNTPWPWTNEDSQPTLDRSHCLESTQSLTTWPHGDAVLQSLLRPFSPFTTADTAAVTSTPLLRTFSQYTHAQSHGFQNGNVSSNLQQQTFPNFSSLSPSQAWNDWDLFRARDGSFHAPNQRLPSLAPSLETGQLLEGLGDAWNLYDTREIAELNAEFDVPERDIPETSDAELDDVEPIAPKSTRVSASKWEMYKEEIIELHWKLTKNLPAATATKMLMYANKRKREEQKDTMFTIGQQIFTTDRVSRTLKRAGIDPTQDFPGPGLVLSPQEFKCITPSTPMRPPSRRVPTRLPEPTYGRWNPRALSPSPSLALPQPITSQRHWNGHTLEDLNNLRQSGHIHEAANNFSRAENDFRNALAGFQRLLSPTHETTISVTYEIAKLYVRYDRIDDAETLLDGISQKLIVQYGHNNSRRARHMLETSELWQELSRPKAAIAALTLAGEISISLFPECLKARSPLLSHTAEEPDDTTAKEEAPMINSARAWVKEPENAMEPLLRGILKEGERHPDNLTAQYFEIRALLVDFYQAISDFPQLARALEQAEVTLRAYLERAELTDDSTVRAVFSLIARLAQARCSEEASILFHKFQRSYRRTFASNIECEKATQLFLGIGIMFDKAHWDFACPFFEQCLAVVLSEHDVCCSAVKHLERVFRHKELRQYSFSENRGQRFQESRCWLANLLKDLSQSTPLSSFATKLLA
ncbi:MAG: hypothetical protein Q9160_000180 [Pyrenula sp. 1 TL-2023]